MTSNLVQRHVWSYKLCQNLGQIDLNLHDHVFDDVICKPPIVEGPEPFTVIIGTLSKLTRRLRGGGHIQISIQLKSE